MKQLTEEEERGRRGEPGCRAPLTRFDRGGRSGTVGGEMGGQKGDGVGGGRDRTRSQGDKIKRARGP